MLVALAPAPAPAGAVGARAVEPVVGPAARSILPSLLLRAALLLLVGRAGELRARGAVPLHEHNVHGLGRGVVPGRGEALCHRDPVAWQPVLDMAPCAVSLAFLAGRGVLEDVELGAPRPRGAREGLRRACTRLCDGPSRRRHVSRVPVSHLMAEEILILLHLVLVALGLCRLLEKVPHAVAVRVARCPRGGEGRAGVCGVHVHGRERALGRLGEAAVPRGGHVEGGRAARSHARALALGLHGGVRRVRQREVLRHVRQLQGAVREGGPHAYLGWVTRYAPAV
mmetsp:Transcript_40867/g.109781  ORF Transcript_40867/g.109781 Transcript_40867/m.109781 type:complete len:283 (+) Transcript_40867:779-1627(+)